METKAETRFLSPSAGVLFFSNKTTDDLLNTTESLADTMTTAVDLELLLGPRRSAEVGEKRTTAARIQHSFRADGRQHQLSRVELT